MALRTQIPALADSRKKPTENHETETRGAEKRMAVFLLWNVAKKPLDGLVQSLVRQHKIDIILLVEFAFGSSQLSGMLLADGLFKRESSERLSERFGVFSRVTHKVSPLQYRLGGRVGFWEWTPPSGQQGLIILLHGLDRRNYDDSTRRVFFRRIADAVKRCEKARSHKRTIIVGDFNAPHSNQP